MMDELDPQDPPPPPGFTPVQQAQDPPPPPGFTPVGSDQVQPGAGTPAQPDDGWGTFRKEHPYLSTLTDVFQGAGAGAFSTLHGMDKLGTKGWSALTGAPPQENIIPPAWTQAPKDLSGKLGKAGEQIGEFFLPGGAIGEVNDVIKSSKLPWLAQAGARALAEGAPAAGVTYAQTGGNARAAAVSGGVAGGAAAALPLAAAWATHLLGKRTGVGVEAIEKAVEGSPDFEKGLSGELSEADILKTARDALEGLKEERRVAYEAALQQLPQSQVLDLKPVRSAFVDSLRGHRIGFQIDPQTYQPILDFSRSPVKNDAGAMQALRDTASDLWQWGSRAGDLKPSGVDALKRIVADRYSPTMQGRAVIQATAARVRDILNTVPGYQKMTQGYAEASDLLDNMADLSLHSKNDGTAIRKLTTILNQNNGYRSGLLQSLSRIAGVDIGAQVAGNRMNTWAPRGIAGPIHAASMLISPHTLATWLGALTLSSPRAAANVVQGAAKIGPYIPRAAGALPSLFMSGQQPDYDANYQQNVPRQAKGGKVRYDDGGDVDASQDPVLQDLARRTQVNFEPGKPSNDAAMRALLEQGKDVQMSPEEARKPIPDDDVPVGYERPQGLPGPPAPPKPSLPWEAQVQQPKENGDLLDKYLLGPMTAGAGKLAQGVEGLASTPGATAAGFMQMAGNPAYAAGQLATQEPDVRNAVGAAGNVVSGGLDLLAPFMLASGLESPTALAKAVVTLGGANKTQEVVENAARDQGWAPEYVAAVGSAAGLAAGSLLHGAMPEGAPATKVNWGDVKEAVPSKEDFQASADAARQRLIQSGAFQGATFGSGAGGLGKNLGDIATLTAADIGVGAHSAAEIAAAKARQVSSRIVNAAGKSVRGGLDEKGKTYIPDPADVEKTATKMYPGLSGYQPYDVAESAKAQSLMDRARTRSVREANSTLSWKNWDRPALENEYGQLVPSKPLDQKRVRLQNTPAAVEKRVQNARDFLRQPVEEWVPPDYGVFDRSLIKDAMHGFPDVEQTQYPRTVAPQADLSHVTQTYENPANQELIRLAVERGRKLKGDLFYPSVYPMKVAAMDAGISEADFNRWIYGVSPASAKNSVMAENTGGNLLYRMWKQGIPLTKENLEAAKAAFKDKYNVAPSLMETHLGPTAKVLEQGILPPDVVRQNLTDRYKIPTYAMGKTGDFKNYFVGDVHESRGTTLASPWHPYFAEQEGFGGNEYGPMENYMRDLARGMDMATGPMQGARWHGAGELTNLKSEPGDWLNTIEKQAAFTMHEQGMRTQPQDVRNYLLNLIRQGGELAPWSKKSIMPDFRERTPQRSRSRGGM